MPLHLILCGTKVHALPNGEASIAEDVEKDKNERQH